MAFSKPQPGYLLGGAVFALLLCSFLPASTAHALAAPFSAAVRFIVSPVSTWMHQTAVALRPAPEVDNLMPTDTEALREELERVWQYNRQLEQELLDARKTIQHLGRMRQLLPDTQTDLIVGRVTGSSIGKSSPSLSIDLGTRMGLSPGLAVVSGFNLVGQVVESSEDQSLVRPITTNGTLLNLRLLPPNAGTPARETFVHAEAKSGLFTGIVGVSDPVQIGDLAHLYDETWPAEARGFVVGRVESLEPLPREPLLRRTVTIRPIRPAGALDRVVVLIPTTASRTPAKPGAPTGPDPADRPKGPISRVGATSRGGA